MTDKPGFDEKTAINIEAQRLYNEGMRSGKHGHYETMFVAMHQAYAMYFDGTLPPLVTLARDDLERMRFKGH